MECVAFLLLLGSVIYVSAKESNSVTCSFDSNETDCFLDQRPSSNLGSFSTSSGPTPRIGTGPDRPYEGDQFLLYSTINGNHCGTSSLVAKSKKWSARNYCLKLAYHQLVTNTAYREFVNFYVRTWNGLPYRSFGNIGNKWITWATDLNLKYPLKLEIVFKSGDNNAIDFGLDSVKMIPKKCGCLKQPCKNGGTCNEKPDGTFRCKCPSGIYGKTCDRLGEGAMACTFEAKEYYLDDCFFKEFLYRRYYRKFKFGKHDKSFEDKNNTYYIYIDPVELSLTREPIAILYFYGFTANCFSFNLSMDVLMHDENVGDLRIMARDWTVMELKGNQGPSWIKLSTEIIYYNDLNIQIIYNYSNLTKRGLALDNLALTCTEPQGGK